MCGYQQVNGTHCSENKWLLNDVLRNDFGFNGVVMTDWGATKDRVLGIKAGIDLDMPGEIIYNKKLIIDSVNNGNLDIKDLNTAVENILNLVFSFKENKKYNMFFCNFAHVNLREYIVGSFINYSYNNSPIVLFCCI
jgi:beta-glucosidase